ncbi:uncharacterized protein LOC125698262 isoform X5 [Lagopus muta]|uniref:uncharacterized protein LOC125698262 isoform X5 n=1 Tax=Lagopus muta TaxID=64668 RepID=UPI0020A1CCB9|nr:uncharacterized protein LOC125698262 isoform X5 [Lagopus muta]
MSFLPDGPPGAGELLAADPAGQGPTIPPAPVLAALLAVAGLDGTDQGSTGEQLQAGKCQHPQLHLTLPILPPIGQTCFCSVPMVALDSSCPPELIGDDLPDLFPGPWRSKPLQDRHKPVGWHLAGGDMWWCPQAVAGAASTAAFFLCEGLLGRHFDVVPNGAAEPQPGDLFLFPLASRGPGWWGAHAGVYCGDGEIIHLEGTSGTSPTGIVAKHGKSHLLRTRGPAKVLRMKGGLDAAALQWRIRAAMDMVLDYDAVTCNCIHFALALLGLGQLTGDMMFPALQ